VRQSADWDLGYPLQCGSTFSAGIQKKDTRTEINTQNYSADVKVMHCSRTVLLEI
jgi:hypothetical protein